MILRLRLCPLIAFLIFPGMLAAQSDDLLTRIWDGVQQAQKKYTSGCGTITETRTSSLLVKPMVLHGRFCAEGTTRFMLEYSDPVPFRILFNITPDTASTIRMPTKPTGFPSTPISAPPPTGSARTILLPTFGFCPPAMS